jgi:hypothetical protein
MTLYPHDPSAWCHLIPQREELVQGRRNVRTIHRAKAHRVAPSKPMLRSIGFAHLDESQRAMVAARLANMKQGARTDLAPIGAMSDAKAAKMLSVGRASVERAKTVQAARRHGVA